MSKLFVFDLDGTLLNSDGKIPKENVEAIKVIHKNKHYVAIATGRPHYMATHIAKEANIDYIIGNNGSCVVKYEKGEMQVVTEIFLDKDITRQMLEFSKKHKTGVMSFLRECNYFVDYEKDANKKVFNTRVERLKNYMTEEISKQSKYTYDGGINKDLEKEILNESYKVILTPTLDRQKDIIEKIQKELGDKVSIFPTHDGTVEINPNGVNKYVESKILKERLKVDELYAFGDDWNDYENIKNADTGVAMGNANEHIKEVADMVTDTNDNAGVAKAVHLVYQDL